MGYENCGKCTKAYYDKIKSSSKLPINEKIRRDKISIAMKGRDITWKNKISNSLKGNKNGKDAIFSEERKIKISKNSSISIREKINKEGYNWGMKNKHHSEESNKKNRLSVIRYLEKTKLDGMPLKPRIGNSEKVILDKIENDLGYKIIRQKEIDGYYIDGYIQELNIAIEIDEKFHKTIKDKDKKRQKYIEDKMKCKFVRVKL